jgi:hypothetical protein
MKMFDQNPSPPLKNNIPLKYPAEKIFEISTLYSSQDFAILRSVVNQGIDSRLEGFTRSAFIDRPKENRFYFRFVQSEIQILIRRLLEMETEKSELMADDIVLVAYGVEII